ncbi:MAG: phosphotransferase-like protein, partial [Cypionkella sp.]
EQREAARGDRPIGSARQDYETVHVGKVYDLELNSLDGPDANVQTVLAAWRSGRRHSSFQRRSEPAGS